MVLLANSCTQFIPTSVGTVRRGRCDGSRHSSHWRHSLLRLRYYTLDLQLPGYTIFSMSLRDEVGEGVGKEAGKEVIGKMMRTLLTTVYAGLILIALGACASMEEPAKEAYREGAQFTSDASITAAVKFKFAKDHQVNALDINVDTVSGVVTLYGHVEQQALVRRAVDLARSVKGVKKVVPKLVVLTP